MPTSRFLVGRFHSYKTVITGWQRGFWGRLRRVLGGADLVCFPYHHGGRHVEPLNEPGILVCPQVMGTFALESNAHAAKPCQQCQFCLPA